MRCAVCSWPHEPQDLADVDGQLMCAACILLHVGDPWAPDRVMEDAVGFVGSLT